MDCQAARRDSRGCVLQVVGWDNELLSLDVVGARDERSVSRMPGAEGAPPVVELVLLVVVAWLGEGAMRRDWE